MWRRETKRAHLDTGNENRTRMPKAPKNGAAVRPADSGGDFDLWPAAAGEMRGSTFQGCKEFSAKANSRTTWPLMRCSWMIRSSTVGVQE